MLRFFRNIRQKLIEQENVRKYFFYAIGEVFLVVIGILIALQVNNWNQVNKDHEISITYHSRMISDIEQMVLRLEAEIVRANGVRKSISQAVIILEEKKFNDSTEVVLDQALIRYFQLAPVSFQIASYDEMKSTGRLNLIYNVELRQRLNAYANYESIISAIVDQYSKTVNGSTDLFNQYVRIYVGEGPNHKISYDNYAIAKDPALINTLSRFAYEWDGYKYFLEVMIDQMNGLKQEIQLELNNLSGQ